MSRSSEHKTVQARILAYAEAKGRTFVPREQTEQRRGLKERGLSSPRHRQKGGQECPPSLFFDDQLDAKLRKFNPRYAEAEGALLGQFHHLHTDIHGNRECVEYLRNGGKFFTATDPICFPCVASWNKVGQELEHGLGLSNGR